MGEWWSIAPSNWFSLLSAVGVVGSLIFAGLSFRLQVKTMRVSNLIAVTQSHREIWREMFGRQNLHRVLTSEPDLQRSPVSVEEETFVLLVILHLHMVFRAGKQSLLVEPEGIRRDVWWFFTQPIPAAVWEKEKVLQDDDFVVFVESCRNWK